MTSANETLKRALSVALARPQEALEILAAGLEAARESGDRQGAGALAKHAGLMCAERGDLQRAILYYEEALDSNPHEAYISFALGDLRRKLGQWREAHAAFARSLELATSQGDSDLVELASKAVASLEGETDPGSH